MSNNVREGMITLEEMKEQAFGKIGTPLRDRFERNINTELLQLRLQKWLKKKKHERKR